VSGDFDFEPIPGLPAPLPPGEQLLWQGAPRWQTLALRAFHVRKVAGYFGLLVLIRFSHFIGNGVGVLASLKGCLVLLGLGITGVGLLTLLAFLSARGTVYSITSRRVLIRHGIAVPMTLNVPFAVIEAAGVKADADRSGQIALELTGRDRIGYLVNWPHVRPGRFTRPEPMLRALRDVAGVATILTAALAAATGTSSADRPLAPAAGVAHREREFAAA
jgi:Bacterial PH domain